jgi:hypothetical protein
MTLPCQIGLRDYFDAPHADITGESPFNGWDVSAKFVEVGVKLGRAATVIIGEARLFKHPFG